VNCEKLSENFLQHFQREFIARDILSQKSQTSRKSIWKIQTAAVSSVAQREPIATEGANLMGF